jgi:hypothetical protein
MTTAEATKVLLDAGFNSGWVVSDGVLILWENDEDPPSPLTKPAATKQTK